VLAKDTLRIAVVGRLSNPVHASAKCSDQTFGRVCRPRPASRPVADIEAAKPPRTRVLFRSTCRRTVVTFRRATGIKRHDPNFHGRLCRETTFSAAEDCPSRLYHEVREKARFSPIRSLNRCCGMDHSAIFYGKYRKPAPTAPGETVAAIDKEIRRMAEDGPTQQELDEAKSYLKGLANAWRWIPRRSWASALLQYQLDKLPSITIEKAQRHRRRR